MAGVEWLWNSGLYRRMRDCMHVRLSLATNTEDHAPGNTAHHRLRAAHRPSFPSPLCETIHSAALASWVFVNTASSAQGCVGFHRGIKDNWSSRTWMNFPTSLHRLLEELGMLSRESEDPLEAAGRSV